MENISISPANLTGQLIISITPEMIDAGVHAFFSEYDHDEDGLGNVRATVAAILRAAFSTARHGPA